MHIGEPYAEKSRSGRVYIRIKTKSENLTDSDSRAAFFYYVVDPNGVQKSSGTQSSGWTVPGATQENDHLLARIDESEFIHGTYTIIIRNNRVYSPDIERRFEFKLDLTKKYFE